ncbi:hypothetical protein KIPB_005644, partial [Kipferlia bialata]|eukprot:g5644.t1
MTTTSDMSDTEYNGDSAPREDHEVSMPHRHFSASRKLSEQGARSLNGIRSSSGTTSTSDGDDGSTDTSSSDYRAEDSASQIPVPPQIPRIAPCVTTATTRPIATTTTSTVHRSSNVPWGATRRGPVAIVRSTGNGASTGVHHCASNMMVEDEPALGAPLGERGGDPYGEGGEPALGAPQGAPIREPQRYAYGEGADEAPLGVQRPAERERDAYGEGSDEPALAWGNAPRETERKRETEGYGEAAGESALDWTRGGRRGREKVVEAYGEGVDEPPLGVPREREVEREGVNDRPLPWGGNTIVEGEGDGFSTEPPLGWGRDDSDTMLAPPPSRPFIPRPPRPFSQPPSRDGTVPPLPARPFNPGAGPSKLSTVTRQISGHSGIDIGDSEDEDCILRDIRLVLRELIPMADLTAVAGNLHDARLDHYGSVATAPTIWYRTRCLIKHWMKFFLTPKRSVQATHAWLNLTLMNPTSPGPVGRWVAYTSCFIGVVMVLLEQVFGLKMYELETTAAIGLRSMRWALALVCVLQPMCIMGYRQSMAAYEKNPPSPDDTQVSKPVQYVKAFLVGMFILPTLGLVLQISMYHYIVHSAGIYEEIPWVPSLWWPLVTPKIITFALIALHFKVESVSISAPIHTLLAIGICLLVLPTTMSVILLIGWTEESFLENIQVLCNTFVESLFLVVVLFSLFLF